MSKGYADYLVWSARQLDRELERDADGIEVPLFREEYTNWLNARPDLSNNSKTNYQRWLVKADEWILDVDQDFWRLLKNDWQSSDFSGAKNRCEAYERLLISEKAEAEKAEANGDKDFGVSAKEIGNWISAFRKYRRFLDEALENSESEQRAHAAKIAASRETAKNLFLDSMFISWGEAKGRSVDTIESYVSNIKRVNRDLFCKTGYDIFHVFIPRAVRDKDLAEIEVMFSKMDEKLTSRIDNYDETEMDRSALQNSRSALRLYADFIKETVRNTVEKEKTETPEAVTDQRGDSDAGIYKIDEFREWLPLYGRLGEKSASSYISYLKALGRDMSIEENGVGFLSYASWLLREDKVALALEVLERGVAKLSLVRSSDSTPEKKKKDLNYQRSALKRYIEFLQDEVEDLPDEEEFEEVASDVPEVTAHDVTLDVVEDGDLIGYSIEELRKNFAFRLNTQNRMSKDKEVFYPISIIRKLFCYSQRKGKKAGTLNNDYDWFKDWNEDYIGEIKVLEQEGNTTMSELSDLQISPSSGKVYAIGSGSKRSFQVFTETTAGDVEQMKAKSLGKIHIDHSPLMSDVLKDNVSSIPALNTLSDEIKTIAKAKRVDITTKNFGKLSKLLFADSQFVDEHLLPLIPALREELALLRKKSTLTLMDASNNLRKK